MKSALEIVHAANHAFAAAETRLLAEISDLKALEIRLRDECLQQQEALRQLIGDRDQAIVSRDGLNTELRSNLDLLREAVADRDHEISRLNAELLGSDAELEESNLKVKAERERCEAMLARAQDANRTLALQEEQIRSSSTTLARQDAQISLLTEAIQLKGLDLKEAESARDRMASLCNERLSEVNWLRAQCDELRGALDRKNADAERFLLVVQDLEDKLRTYDQTAHQRAEALLAHSQFVSQKDHAIVRLEQALETSESRVVHLVESIERHASDAASLEFKLASAKQEIAALIDSKASLELHLTQHQAELSAAFDSTVDAEARFTEAASEATALRGRLAAADAVNRTLLAEVSRLSEELNAFRSSRILRVASRLQRQMSGRPLYLAQPSTDLADPMSTENRAASITNNLSSMPTANNAASPPVLHGVDLSLETLLTKQDHEFIDAAYRRLLRRAADPHGHAYYLARLRAGAQKIQLLLELAASSEARAAGADLPGLREAARRVRWFRWPLLGRMLRSFFRPESVAETQARLRIVEQQIARLSTSGANNFERLNRTLVEVGTQVTSLRKADGGGAQKSAVRTRTKPPVFFTICAKNFTAYAKTLFDSIVAHHPTAEFFLFLCDEPDPKKFDVAALPFRVVMLPQLDIADLTGMASRYNITEFNTAIKPFAFQYLFKIRDAQEVVYLDPDILVTSPLQEVLDGLGGGADCVLTPHILDPAERAEVSDDKLLLFGIYNLGFLALRQTPRVIEIVEWWGRRLEHECVIALEKGLFVDQKWVDLFPAFIPNTLVLRHAGYNVAYWNLPQRTVGRRNGTWFANDEPLRFAHFSGNKLDDPKVYSRHSWTLNTENIGDLKILLDHYREAVYANGHLEYSKLPYAYSWSGASGVNLHTPEPARVATAVQVARAASASQGQGTNAPIALDPVNPVEATSSTRTMVPRIFVSDWSTPRPDQDAGSVTTYFLLKSLTGLGYDVTFVPSDLEPLGPYTQAVRNLGVECLDRDEIESIPSYLATEGDKFSAFVLFRAPVAALYLTEIRRRAPSAKVVLETVDLHYLREERSALAQGTSAAIEAARQTKEWELGIVAACDVAIVLSSVEQQLLEKELPGRDIRTMPLLFLDMPGPSGRGHSERADLLFIGGFRHSPNVDAMLWFCADIWPRVRARLPGVRFLIVGSHPTAEILELSKVDGVTVLGHVKDLDPVFGTIRLSVTPLRYGAGIKGKVATSLGYGVPVIGTSLSFEGMELRHDKHVLIADDAAALADAIVLAYTDEARWERLSRMGLERINALYSEQTGRNRVRDLMDSLGLKTSDFEFQVFRSMAAYATHRRDAAREYEGRSRLELSLIDRAHDSFQVEGYCAVCARPSVFQVGFMYSYQISSDGKPIPNWREHLNCGFCGHTNRVRLVLHLIERYLRPTPAARIYVSEQTTPLYRHLQSRYRNLTGSEFLGDRVPFGHELNGLRNEDMTKLTFAEQSFDLVISCDVLEHVGDDVAAFAECFRCLAPNGKLIFTVPCSLESEKNIVRARMRASGEIEHLINPPEFHGNPVDPERGALCFRYFGWEVLDQLRSVGFSDAYAISAWSRSFAYLGGEQIVFVATRGAA